MCSHQVLLASSRGGLGVEQWSAPVDRIPLGETIPAMSMFYVLTKLLKPIRHTTQIRTRPRAT